MKAIKVIDSVKYVLGMYIVNILLQFMIIIDMFLVRTHPIFVYVQNKIAKQIDTDE